MTRLFRDEAVEYSTRRISGDVVLASSLNTRILAILLCSVVFGAVIFAASASYARRETVQGWLVPETGMIRVTTRQAGTLTELHVREGDLVEVGQPIATVTSSSSLAGGDSYTALSAALEAQRVATVARGQASISALDAERAALTRQLSSLQGEVQQLRRRSEIQDQRLQIARNEVARAETIAAQGFLTQRDLEARRAASLSLEQDASQLASQASAHEREIDELQARLAAIPIDLDAARADAAAAGAAMDRTGIETEASSVQVVASTVAGRIAVLPFKRGQSLAAGTAVAVVTDADAAIQAELYAPTRATGFLQEGQEVRLQYQAYPHQKFGTGQGFVKTISDSTLTPSEVPLPGVAPDEPVVRLEVALSASEVSAYGRSAPLKPGMLLSADVIVDRRSLLEWLLDPLYAAGRR